MKRTVAAAMLVVGLGCTSAPSDIDNGPLVQVDAVTSTSGEVTVAMLAHGASPVRGLHTMELIFTHVADGTPVVGLTLDVVPWMPAMGHGTSLTPVFTELGSGAYQIDDLDLFMAGQWQLRTTFGTPPDTAAPALQIE